MSNDELYAFAFVWGFGVTQGFIVAVLVIAGLYCAGVLVRGVRLAVVNRRASTS